eukprot:CAMPEP_0175886616 /NCGR_PEP_ID=MMETSP0107_2-20121207/45726_1 /TAXON_ID=195067 ORGANISM="Goniomonas pacifica, Strain CCMP1869" /NCGR_SAMPLE_ID=MMETSP0107_2 /ASSEMBLY_ACC=CAM_ASM_000203 /LENGTH=105 /DNA_ID=CAMNT_0017206999 /DNA_START=64 /DNA_END=377 /DNA_ORIENTATION=-
MVVELDKELGVKKRRNREHPLRGRRDLGQPVQHHSTFLRWGRGVVKWLWLVIGHVLAAVEDVVHLDKDTSTLIIALSKQPKEVGGVPLCEFSVVGGVEVEHVGAA